MSSAGTFDASATDAIASIAGTRDSKLPVPALVHERRKLTARELNNFLDLRDPFPGRRQGRVRWFEFDARINSGGVAVACVTSNATIAKRCVMSDFPFPVPVAPKRSGKEHSAREHDSHREIGAHGAAPLE